MSPFIHLETYSNHSFLRGAAHPHELAARAAELGYAALTLSDLNNLSGAVPFYRECRARGVKPIIGAAIDEPGRPERRAIVLAENLDGYRELCRLVTARLLGQEWPNGEAGSGKREVGDGKRESRSGKREVGKSANDQPSLQRSYGLAGKRRATSDDFSLAKALTNAKNVTVLIADAELLQELREVLPAEKLFARLLLDGRPGSYGCCQRLVELARQLGLGVVAANAVHFIRRDGFKRHLLLRAIDERTTVFSARRATGVNANHYLRPRELMASLFAEIPAALENSARIAARCELELPLGEYKFPHFKLPRKWGGTAHAYLERLCLGALHRRYPGRENSVGAYCNTPLQRLCYELSVIKQMNFSEYFLVVRDIARRARRMDVPSIGRGSAANSIVSYLLGLTHVDPLRYGLPFERFLNPSRITPPDVDLDFSWRERDRVLDYVYTRYGRKRVAMIATIIRFRGSSAFADAAKALGLSEEEARRVSRRLPWGGVEKLAEVEEKYPECRGLDLDGYPDVVSAAMGISDYPRHFSVHPGGIVIAPEDMRDHISLTRAKNGLVVTTADMFAVDDLGLVKIDLLSQRSLGVLRDTVRMVGRRTGKRPLPGVEEVFRDEGTRRLIRRGDTMGCFYIESPAMRSLLKKLRVDNYEALVAASSVIRPGVSESGMMRQYVERHLYPEKRAEAPPVMLRLLPETYGVMVYQEDVLRLAHELAGLSLSEADVLRRAMSGKSRSQEAMTRLEEEFLRGCRRKGVNAGMARDVWRQMESFAGYAFCKAHSASYAVLSFQLAYLKLYYPSEFMAAVLANGGGFYWQGAYVEEARRLGLRILPPDVNRGGVEWGSEGQTIRVGLLNIKGMSEKTVARINAERKRGGAFLSLHDFLRRTGAGFSEAASLIKVGAFSSLPFVRPELLWQLELLRGRKTENREPRTENLPIDEPNLLPREMIPRLPDYSFREKCRMEMELLGYPLGGHPLDLIESRVQMQEGESLEVTRDAGRETRDPIAPEVDSSKLSEMRGRRVTIMGQLISTKLVRSRKSGKPRTGDSVAVRGKLMKFMSFSDRTGTFEATLFPESYQRLAAKTVEGGAYLVTGRVECEFGAESVVVDDIEPLSLRQ